MSATFMYEVMTPTTAKHFRNGTSSDADALRHTFNGVVSIDHLPVLMAMHRATHMKESLWLDIAETLERLSGDGGEVSLKVWVEY